MYINMIQYNFAFELLLQIIRCGLCPYSPAQQFCKLWLEDFFEAEADNDPASQQSLIQLMVKGDLYTKYKHEQTARRIPVVTSSRFMQLWRYLFPTYSTRTWCDKPGHCQTCWEIDSGRKHAQTRSELKRWKEVHYLHRTGLFGLEREE